MKTNDPILQQDMIGSAKNYYPNRVFDFVIGKATGVNNTRVDMWEGPTSTYVFPTVAQQMRVVSSSANDTAAGTGIQKLYIHYLDANYLPQIEVVTLNGVTPVNTVATNIIRINGVHASQVGSGGVAAGNIQLQNTAGTVTYGWITAGFNTARQAIYTVPAGYSGYISHWQASSGTTTGTHFTQIEIRSTSHAGMSFPGVFLVLDEVGTLNSASEISFPIPVMVPEKTDVKMTAISDAANAAATCLGAIMGWVEKN